MQLHRHVRGLVSGLVAAALLSACGSVQSATKLTPRPGTTPAASCSSGPANPEYCQGLTFLGDSKSTAGGGSGNCGGMRATSTTDAIASINVVGVGCRAARRLTIVAARRCSESNGKACQLAPWSCRTTVVHLGLATQGECAEAAKRVTWVTTDAA